ncbi:glyoxylase-like metal-dependent hydrolase (beta-lactamase superfamily II) [Caulobacter ginsengisoli]|uniref:Glyoxylase-like metal-dependent hydrolase (Beta-lactamase superfamily II) n=1 Tax=Caulobacter ginsengisoli TaxID=400775 RepID=A0ABU0ISK6_9CAUL|nr:MBL fold metallo-hydrolase [Caulobacter ginsengisoli]MDQ0464341.1 glyoxylase-like metal-dependent hydrolase (beta-lactamase superfamily II) [Caulobacter ginsengisoli]
MRWLAGLAAVLALGAAPLPPQPQAVAPGVWLMPGGIVPQRQPDGNTVVFAGPRGLVVLDTGRHLWHRQAILDFAAARRSPIVAVVNSHWHLDHVSGNPDIKRAYPGLKVYASNAIDEALKGFLPRSAADGRKYLNDPSFPVATLEDLRADLATIENGQALRPDVVIDRSSVRTLAGLRLQVNLAPNAATDGDVWLYDPKSRVAAVGDLVTLPAAFLDTGCPQGWKTALDRIWATPFRIVIPGHGAPMTRDQFGVYRTAFGALVDCSISKREASACAADWAAAVKPLLGDDARALRQASGMTQYYVTDVLRAHGGKSLDCKAA